MDGDHDWAVINLSGDEESTFFCGDEDGARQWYAKFADYGYAVELRRLVPAHWLTVESTKRAAPADGATSAGA